MSMFQPRSWGCILALIACLGWVAQSAVACESLPTFQSIPNSAESERGESETPVVNTVNARRCVPSDLPSQQVITRLVATIPFAASPIDSQVIAPVSELDNRNGFGAPLQC